MIGSIRKLTAAIDEVLGGSLHSVWLYGSVVLDDFRPGWSDIDILALTKAPITESQAEALLLLRQRLYEAEPENPYYRAFEGIVAQKDEYLARSFTRLVYWGTSGQRVTDCCERDVFAEYELRTHGECVFGEDDRSIFILPSREELDRAVLAHYEGVRAYAKETDDRLYSCGWLLDIARCLYTLWYGEVIGKTQAGEWALHEHLFADEAPLIKTIAIRREPLRFKDREETKRWLKGLGPVVQQYADVLARELCVSETIQEESNGGTL